MQTMDIEILGEVPVYFGVGCQVMSAIILGGIVGYDREKKMKSAGLKTNIMICLGATLYTTISLLNVQNFTGPMDPNRVGAQIVSGIGFLGAGAIIQGRGSVVGMTTAATIWVVAAIGYTVGVGYPVSAALFSITVLMVLKWINPIYQFFENEKPTEYFHIEVLSFGSVKRSIMEKIKLENVEFDELHEDPIDKKRTVFTLYVHSHPRVMDRLIGEIKDLASVIKVSCHTLDPQHKYEKDSKVVEFFKSTGSDSQRISWDALGMKKETVLALTFTLGVNAHATSPLTTDQQKLLNQRLKIFGLTKGAKALPLVGDEKRVRTDYKKKIQEVLKNLNADLKGSYLEKAQSALGKCEEESCLSEVQTTAQDHPYLSFKGHDEDHCYPNTTCGYYECMEQKYQCMDVDVPYFEKLAKPTCQSYVKNIKDNYFSFRGKEWIYNVMVCLQKGLFEECSLRGNCPPSENREKVCNHVTEFTLKFHPGCYINSGVGVCKLPLTDQVNIWRTVGPYLTDREKEEAIKVVRYCLFKNPIN